MSKTKKNLNTLISILSSDKFWHNAFDKDAPFYDSYIKYYKRGVVEGIPNVLDMHWDAIYYLKDHALLPIITRLIQLLAKYPEASFIESLSFFLSRDIQQDRLRNAFSSADTDTLQLLLTNVDYLSSYYNNSDDEDMVEQILMFKSLLVSLK